MAFILHRKDAVGNEAMGRKFLQRRSMEELPR